TPREMSSVDIYKGIVEKKNKLKQKKEENKQELGTLKSRMFLEFNPFTTTKPHDQALNSYVQKISSLEKKTFFDRSLQVYELEFNKKFSVTFACIIFIFFSFPVSLYTKKSGRSVGFGLGLLVSVFYWSMLFVGQTLGIRISLSPVVAMWTPNIIILLIGTYLMFRRLRI
ncbi:MAG: YjgP/YjgQ family permease, partial [Spirochaetes bacterium]